MRYFISTLAILLAVTHSQAAEIYTVPTRGVSISYCVVNDGQLPKAAFLLFPGGDGTNNFRSQGGKMEFSKNFLARTVEAYVRGGFTTAIVGPPSDLAGGLTIEYRKSSNQATDIQAIMNDLARRGVDSFFLVGTSRGTLSVVSLATLLNDSRIKGVILTSTIDRVNKLPLSRINVPALVVHHVNDGCQGSTLSEAKRTSQLIPRASFVEITGGAPPRSDPCAPLSPHGFFGVEGKATNAMISWARTIR